MKVYHHLSSKSLFLMFVLVLGVGLFAGCASQRKTKPMNLPPDPQTQPTMIELNNSRLSDLLKEGDIPEEDRGQLSWLPTRPPKGMRFEATTELQVVYFEFDKHSLTSSTKTALNNNALWLKNHPEVAVQLEGHCDERGTQEYNQVLGENRAFSVKKYLVTLGIASERLFTISYGETMPAASGNSEDAWGKNRRVVFRISR